MANDEHVALLKKGVAAWNAWRGENLNIRPDLGKADLREAKLGKAPLEYPFGVNLVQANLSGADLRGRTSARQTSSRLISSMRTSAARTSARRTSLGRSSPMRASSGRTSVHLSPAP
jgi:uncharacterized protein YjbI with pentapeptide repeats